MAVFELDSEPDIFKCWWLSSSASSWMHAVNGHWKVQNKPMAHTYFLLFKKGAKVRMWPDCLQNASFNLSIMSTHCSGHYVPKVDQEWGGKHVKVETFSRRLLLISAQVVEEVIAGAATQVLIMFRSLTSLYGKVCSCVGGNAFVQKQLMGHVVYVSYTKQIQSWYGHVGINSSLSLIFRPLLPGHSPGHVPVLYQLYSWSGGWRQVGRGVAGWL